MKKTLLILALAAAAGAVQAEDTLAKIKSSGTVTMGVRDSSGALSYSVGEGKYEGFHVDVCRHVLADVQKQLGLKQLNIVYQSVTSQNRAPLVKNGTVDIECGSTTNNTARAQEVDFAHTTYVTAVRMAVRANAGINSISQLNGRNVATTTGTTSVQTLRKNERMKGLDFHEVYGKDHADSFLLLEQGRADAFVMDDYILAGNIAHAKNPAEFKIVGEALSIEPIAIMLRKDDPAFKKAINDSIDGLMKSGEIGKMLGKYGLAPSADTKAAWATPNDKPMESYKQ